MTEQERRDFPTNVVITALTGLLLCELGEMYEVYSFLIGRPVYTHEIPTVGRLVAPHIVSQLPQLDGLDVSNVNRDTARSEIARFAKLFGCSLPLSPIGWNTVADRTPWETLADIIGDDNVIEVQL